MSLCVELRKQDSKYSGVEREREMGLNHHLGWDDKEEEEEENWAKLGMNWLHNV